MSFSKRMGIKPETKDLQLESMDQDLKNSLWSILKLVVFDKMEKKSYGADTDFHEFAQVLWLRYFKLPVDDLSNNNHNTENRIRDYFFKASYNEIYDLLEFIANLTFIYVDEYIEHVNDILEIEFSGYRFIDKMIRPISNEHEIQEIKEAIAQNNKFTSLSGVNIHLSAALNKLSDRKLPDYRNSIKESISALETAFRIVTGESTLGKALKILDAKNIVIDEQLKSGFEKIYAFTNNKQSGIRHAIVDEHNEPDFHDAKFILLLASSMINYLIGKCISQEVKIT